MTGRTHVVVGVATAAAISALLPQTVEPPLRATLLGAAALGALVPDLDTPGSRLARTLGPLRWVLWLVLRVLGVAHRGVTHSVAGLLAASGAIGAFAWCLLPAASQAWVIGGFAVGYASHLLLDASTVSGVPLLSPLSDRRMHLLPRPFRWRTRW